MSDSIVARVVETFTRELAEAITAAGRQDVKVVRTENSSGSEPENLRWYCGKPNSDSEGHFFVGAAPETWEEIGGNSEGLLGRCIEKMLAGHTQATELVANVSSCSAPPTDWPRITLMTSHGNNAPLAMYCVLSPALEAAIDAVAIPAAIAQPSFSDGIHSADLLAHVHVPVTVSFGGTQIRMKDLLNLATGSVVELDQSLSDTVVDFGRIALFDRARRSCGHQTAITGCGCWRSWFPARARAASEIRP